MKGYETNMICDSCNDITEHILEDYKKGVEIWTCKACDRTEIIRATNS